MLVGLQATLASPVRAAGGMTAGTRPALITAAQRDRLAAASAELVQPPSPSSSTRSTASLPQPRPIAMPVDNHSLQHHRRWFQPSPPPPTPSYLVYRTHCAHSVHVLILCSSDHCKEINAAVPLGLQ